MEGQQQNDHHQNEEADLIRQWQNGSYEAISYFQKKYEKRVLTLVSSILGGNFYDTEAIMVETFAQANEKIHGFRLEAKFSTWLLAIAKNLSLNHLRRAKKTGKVQFMDEELLDAFFKESEVDTEQCLSQFLKECLAELTERDRMMTILKYSDELTLAEVAEQFNVSIEGTRKITNQALAQLQKCIRHKLGE